MTEYLIAFNDEWVPDYTDEEMAERSKAVRALRAEMKAAGVFVFLGGLDAAAPVFSVDGSSGDRSSPTVRTSRPRSTSGGSLSWTWPTMRPRGCGRARSRWPVVGRRRCGASRCPGNVRHESAASFVGSSSRLPSSRVASNGNTSTVIAPPATSTDAFVVDISPALTAVEVTATMMGRPVAA